VDPPRAFPAAEPGDTATKKPPPSGPSRTNESGGQSVTRNVASMLMTFTDKLTGEDGGPIRSLIFAAREGLFCRRRATKACTYKNFWTLAIMSRWSIMVWV
jgi:hypothetical protein